MSEVIVCESAVAEKVKAVYQTVCTFSMSRKQLADLYHIEVRQRIVKAPISAARAMALSSYGVGMLDAFIHVITADRCEVVCKGADGSVQQGVDGWGVGLRWKGTDYLFTPIEVQP